MVLNSRHFYVQLVFTIHQKCGKIFVEFASKYWNQQAAHDTQANYETILYMDSWML